MKSIINNEKWRQWFIVSLDRVAVALVRAPATQCYWLIWTRNDTRFQNNSHQCTSIIKPSGWQLRIRNEMMRTRLSNEAERFTIPQQTWFGAATFFFWPFLLQLNNNTVFQNFKILNFFKKHLNWFERYPALRCSFFFILAIMISYQSNKNSHINQSTWEKKFQHTQRQTTLLVSNLFSSHNHARASAWHWATFDWRRRWCCDRRCRRVQWFENGKTTLQ